VLDIDESNVVIKAQNGKESQKWYFDQETLSIKNKQTDLALDIDLRAPV
jgi:hypothetical protein